MTKSELASVVYGFASWLTTRPGTVTAGAEHQPFDVALAANEYIARQGIDLRETEIDYEWTVTDK